MNAQQHSVQRVLVIDDDAVMRDVLSLVLEAEGHLVVSADSGDAAMAVLGSLGTEEMPAVVLTDLQMPGTRGTALAARLREACPRSTVLLAMSGSKPTTHNADAYDGFLLKPFTAADLVKAVRRQDGATQEREYGTGRASAPALDEGIYKQLAAAMSAAQLKELYGMCLDDALVRIARMSAAASVADAATFKREAHSIKGGCGMLGAVELHTLASQMEAGALSCTPTLDEFAMAAGRLRRMLEARS